MVQETGGLGGMPPQKIFNSESLKIAISSTLKPIAVSKGFQKLIIIFFTLTKIALSSAVIFIVNNYYHTPFIARKIRH